MTRKIIEQNTFTSGEISPRLYGRSDTAEYDKGLKTITNALILPHGPLKRRVGSKFIARTKFPSAEIKLIRYQYSQDSAYILEFGNLYIRFFTDNGQVVETDKVITGITKANPAVVTSNSHGYSNGDRVYITEVAGMTQINSSTIEYKVANVAANTFELQDIDGNNINSSAYSTYTSGGVANKIYELVSPYTTAQLEEIQYTQNGNVLYIAHPDVTPKSLSRTSALSWTLESVDFLPPATYESGYLSTGVTITPSATSGTNVNFTASGALFLEGDIGRQIINTTSGQTGRASILSVTSTTVVVCDIIEAFTNTSAISSSNWHLDLSPIVDLEFNGLQAGSVINVRPEYVSGHLGPRLTITGITAANPGVVTSASHGLSNGQSVQINDVVGMTQVNGHVFVVEGVTTDTFQLKGENTSGYTTYASGGIARRDFTGVIKPAFRSADVGKYILANGGVLQIISVNSSTDIDAEVLKSMNDSENTSNWTLEIPTWNSTRGYPRAVGLYEQRLVFGGTDAQPNTVWFSEIGIFEGFGAGPDDDDAIEIELVSNEVNEISWIASGRDLIIGTTGGELTLNSSGAGGLSPSSIQQRARTYHGSRQQQVSLIGDEVIFLQGANRKIRTFRYDFNIDGYTGEDLVFLAEHITEGGVEEVVYAQEPNSIVYAVTTEGDLIAGAYDRPKKVIGWSRLSTDGYYENVQTITKGEEDQVWVTVKRKINGSYTRYIELFLDHEGVDDTDGLSDCYLTYSTPLTVSGISLANPAVVTSTSHGLSNGDLIVIKDLVDPLDSELDEDKTNMSAINGNVFTVGGATANTFTLVGLNTTNYNAYGSGGLVYERITSLTGLNHLEGKTVQVKGDGAVQPSKTVSNGAITIETASGEIVIGLPYTTTIETLNTEYDIGMGSMQGQKARWSRPLLRVYRSAKPMVNGEFVPSRSTLDLMDNKVPLYSGFLEYGGLNWDNTTALTITLSDPLPLTLTGITGTIMANVK